MSAKNFNAHGVPWYASSDMPAIRPKAPRQVLTTEDKARKQRWFRALYAWIRANFADGDVFYLGPDAPAEPTYSIANRWGVYRGLVAEGCLSRVRVDWITEGHRIKPEVVTFYRNVTKFVDGVEVELPELQYADA